ncbi:MAG TPA: VOC family protein [Mycobacteriales bacterium]|nr:VOC family protein [Mycobacteriales bacterium]
MAVSVGFLVIDSADPERLAEFWCGLMDVEIAERIGEGQFVVLRPTADGLTIGFQKVPEPKTGKNRLHLDLVVDDLDHATDRITALGGAWSEPNMTHELEGFLWRCMADVDGNEFDIDVLPS